MTEGYIIIDDSRPVPSGLYVCQPLFYETISITNPYYPNGSPAEPIEIAEGRDADYLLNSFSDHERAVLSRPLVMDYCSELIRTTRVVLENNYDVVLCPLRGARIPQIQARVMSDNSAIFRQFDGTGMSQGTNDERIINELREVLMKNGEPPVTRIGILDTAKGGDSCAALSKLLKSLNREAGQEWDVGFHLLHAHEKRPPRADQAYEYRGSDFRVKVDYHGVADLLFEDEDRLLGYAVQRDGIRAVSHPLHVDGTILYRDGDKLTAYRKGALDDVAIGILSTEISQQIQGLPDAKLVDGERWKLHV